MRVLFSLILSVIHFIYSVILKFRSLRQGSSSLNPQHLLAKRRRIPEHLALLLVAEGTWESSTKDAVVESVVNTVDWCRRLGVRKLTVYEEKELLSECITDIRQSLPNMDQEQESPQAEKIYHPLTPPPSDYSDSRPLSPDNDRCAIPITAIHIRQPIHKDPPRLLDGGLKHRHHFDPKENSELNDLLLCLVSRQSSKPAIAATAQSIAQTQRRQSLRNSQSRKVSQFTLSIDELDRMLEDEDGLSSPDFMIVHHIHSPRHSSAPLELYGFPPWHVRLTELYLSQPYASRKQIASRSDGLLPQDPIPLDEITFRKALDEYASAEMRFGK